MEAEIKRYIQLLQRNAKYPRFRKEVALEFLGYIRALYSLRIITGEKFLALSREHIYPVLDERFRTAEKEVTK